LDNWVYCLIRGAWHAPIIMVDGEKFHQFSEKNPLFDRNKLIELIKSSLGGQL
jgi:predicted methyltransferase